MKVALIYNKDLSGVINTFGMQNKEFYNENTVKRVAESLEKAGHNVAIMDGNKQIIERLENFMPKVTDGEQMGMIFNMAYGIQGESRYTHIPSMLEMLGLPYVGSNPSGHALALDKVLTKIIWKNNDLPTPDFWVFNNSDEDMTTVKFPVIVKPKMESVSFGLKVVHNIPDLQEAVAFIVSEFNQQALVEQFIRGREFAVGLIGNNPVEPFPVLEIDLEGDPDGIQTVDHKKTQPREKICPAKIPPALAEEMQRISIKAFKALNLRDFSRVDIRLDENNTIYLLEINSMASLGATGSYPTAAKVAGYDFDALVNKMLDVATVRYFTSSIPFESNGKGKSLPVRLRAFIKARQPQTERFLERLVNTNSQVRNVDGVNTCSGSIARELGQLGFIQQIYPQLEIGNIHYLVNSDSSQLDYLILLAVDNRTPLHEHENYMAHEQFIDGTAIWQNKGGATILISALRSLRFVRLLKKTRIGILLLTDSTIDNRYSRNLIEAKAQQAATILALSGAGKNGGIIVSRSGSAQYHLKIKLVEKNTPEAVSTTALQFNKMLSAITEISKNDPNDIIAPYDIEFRSNIFKGYAYGSAGISVRYNSPEILDQIEKKISKIVSMQRRSKLFQIQFEGGIKRPPFPQNEATGESYKKLQRLAKQIDVRISSEHRWSSGDICHIQNNLPKLDGLGPVGEGIANENERILRHSLTERALLLALILSSEKD
jgi:D-alanine-D-alanine ligase